MNTNSKFQQQAIRMAMAHVFTAMGDDALEQYNALIANPTQFVTSGAVTFNASLASMFVKLDCNDLALFVQSLVVNNIQLLENLDQRPRSQNVPRFKAIPLAPTFNSVDQAAEWALGATPAQASLCMFNTMAKLANQAIENASSAVNMKSPATSSPDKENENFFILTENGEVLHVGQFNGWQDAFEAVNSNTALPNHLWVFGEEFAAKFLNTLSSMVQAQEPTITVSLHEWCADAANVVGNTSHELNADQLSDVLDHVKQLVLIHRKDESITHVMAELEEAMLSYQLVSDDEDDSGLSLAAFLQADNAYLGHLMSLDEAGRDALIKAALDSGYDGNDTAKLLDVLVDNSPFERDSTEAQSIRIFHDQDPRQSTARSILQLELWCDAVICELQDFVIDWRMDDVLLALYTTSRAEFISGNASDCTDFAVFTHGGTSGNYVYVDNSNFELMCKAINAVNNAERYASKEQVIAAFIEHLATLSNFDQSITQRLVENSSLEATAV